MKTAVRMISLIALIVWIGGIIFFSAVEAPAVFGVLSPVSGGRHLAGEIVGRSLSKLHWLGIICGGPLGLSILSSKAKSRVLQTRLVVAMVVLTGFSQIWITDRMSAIRAQAVAIEQSSPESQVQFDRLHKLSVITEGAVLTLGLAVVFLMARDQEPQG